MSKRLLRNSVGAAAALGVVALGAGPASAALTLQFSGDNVNCSTSGCTGSFTLPDNGSVTVGGETIEDDRAAPGVIEVNNQTPGQAPTIGDYEIANWTVESKRFNSDGNPQTADLVENTFTVRNVSGNPGELEATSLETDFPLNSSPRDARWRTDISPSIVNGELDFTTTVDGVDVTTFDDLPSGSFVRSGTVPADDPLSLGHTTLIDQRASDRATTFDATTAVTSPATVGLLGMGLVVVGVAVSRNRQT